MPTYKTRADKPKSKERKTYGGLPDSKPPKGYGGYCYECMTLIGFESAATNDLPPGKCDHCGKGEAPRYSMETARFDTLLKRAEAGRAPGQ